jgi:signal transduction histidine kinase/ActR/RegA family two-component response regulator
MGTAIGVVSTRPFVAALRTSQQREVAHRAELMARAVGEFARSAQETARQITSRTRIREMLGSYLRAEITTEELRAFTEPKLEDALERSAHAVGVTRLDASGSVVAVAGEPVPNSGRPAPAFDGIALTVLDAGRDGGGAHDDGEDGGAPRILVAAPIEAADGERLGVDLVLFDAEALSDVIRMGDPSDDLARNAALFTGEDFVTDCTGAFGPSNAGSWAWNGDRGEPVYGEPGWTSASAAVSDTQWSVGIALPEERVYGPLRERLLGVSASVVALLLVGVLGAVLTVRPLAGSLVLRSEELEREVSSKTAELEEQRLIAERANQAKTAFLGNMSHDLRTPLQGIMGFLSLLSETVETPEEKKYVRYADESAQDLLRHVDDLLEISRIESGGLQIVEQDFSIRESLRSVVEMIRPQAERKRLSFTARVSNAVPEHIRTDPVRIRQVTLNLLGNAVKYTQSGGVHVRVDYRESEAAAGEIDITVRDTGPGIPETELEGIFDRFSRLHYTSFSQAGSGLGLTISRGLVEMMGGALWCDSKLEEGSVFHVRLPVAEPSPNAGTLEETVGPGTGDRPVTGPLRVLVAEDDRLNGVLITHLLKKLSHSVTVVTNGRSALEAVLQGGYDIVFMDIQMPEMDGIEATQRIRASADPETASIPIIAITAYAAQEDREQFLAAGMTAIVTKPLDGGDLERAISDVGKIEMRAG